MNEHVTEAQTAPEQMPEDKQQTTHAPEPGSGWPQLDAPGIAAVSPQKRSRSLVNRSLFQALVGKSRRGRPLLLLSCVAAVVAGVQVCEEKRCFRSFGRLESGFCHPGANIQGAGNIHPVGCIGYGRHRPIG